jgi:hypothetical protein
VVACVRVVPEVVVAAGAAVVEVVGAVVVGAVVEPVVVL